MQYGSVLAVGVSSGEQLPETWGGTVSSYDAVRHWAKLSRSNLGGRK